MEAKFNYGDKVLINGNIVGIVLFSYNMFSLPHDPCFVYRIIVDAHELCHREVRVWQQKHPDRDVMEIITPDWEEYIKSRL